MPAYFIKRFMKNLPVWRTAVHTLMTIILIAVKIDVLNLALITTVTHSWGIAITTVDKDIKGKITGSVYIYLWMSITRILINSFQQITFYSFFCSPSSTEYGNHYALGECGICISLSNGFWWESPKISKWHVFLGYSNKSIVLYSLDLQWAIQNLGFICAC